METFINALMWVFAVPAVGLILLGTLDALRAKKRREQE